MSLVKKLNDIRVKTDKTHFVDDQTHKELDNCIKYFVFFLSKHSMHILKKLTQKLVNLYLLNSTE